MMVEQSGIFFLHFQNECGEMLMTDVSVILNFKVIQLYISFSPSQWHKTGNNVRGAIGVWRFRRERRDIGGRPKAAGRKTGGGFFLFRTMTDMSVIVFFPRGEGKNSHFFLAGI